MPTRPQTDTPALILAKSYRTEARNVGNALDITTSSSSARRIGEINTITHRLFNVFMGKVLAVNRILINDISKYQSKTVLILSLRHEEK